MSDKVRPPSPDPRSQSSEPSRPPSPDPRKKKGLFNLLLDTKYNTYNKSPINDTPYSVDMEYATGTRRKFNDLVIGKIPVDSEPVSVDEEKINKCDMVNPEKLDHRDYQVHSTDYIVTNNVKLQYYNIIERVTLYSLLIFYASQLLLSLQLYNTYQQGLAVGLQSRSEKLTRMKTIIKFSERKIKSHYARIKLQQNETNIIDIYDLIMHYDNINYDAYARYLKHHNFPFPKNVLLNNLRSTIYHCSKPTIYNQNTMFTKTVLDKNRLRYDDNAHIGQIEDHSFYQTVCQPLMDIKCKDVGDSKINVEYNYEFYHDQSIIHINGSIYKNNTEILTTANNQHDLDHYMPKFLGNRNLLSYRKGLMTALKQNNKSFGDIVSKEKVWCSPPEVGGALDLDIQIKKVEKLQLKLMAKIKATLVKLSMTGGAALDTTNLPPDINKCAILLQDMGFINLTSGTQTLSDFKHTIPIISNPAGNDMYNGFALKNKHIIRTS